MSPKKKLFESADFDKKKKLFTPSDFDKESEEKIPHEYPKDQKNGSSNSKKCVWIILGAIVVCIVGCLIFFKSVDTIVTKPEQETQIVQETIVSTDSLTTQVEMTEEILPVHENKVSNNAEDQKVKGIPGYDKNSNIATSTTKHVAVSNDVEAEAMKVIRGDYGVGQERKDKLGTQYQPIQNRVNQLKREGAF